MLEVFRREEVENFVCVVTRYFGGVLLGTGGLSRAYSQAAKDALLAAGVVTAGFWRKITFSCNYGMLQRWQKELLAAGAEVDYTYGESVLLQAEVPEGMTASLIERIRDLSGGQTIPVVSEAYLR